MNVSFVGLVNRLTTEGGVPYFLAPGNHDVTSSDDLASPGRAEGLRNYLSAMAKLIPPDGATRAVHVLVSGLVQGVGFRPGGNPVMMPDLAMKKIREYRSA